MQYNSYSAPKLIIVFLIVTCFWNPPACVSTPPDESANLETLRLTQVIFRHGDRNPVKTYPNDPYKNATKYWPGGFGALTDKGKVQQYNLGRFLRHRYDTFISPGYVKSEIQVLSSDMDRTIMSAEVNLAGFYQPINSTLNWNPNLAWTPVPFRTIAKYEDKFLQLKKPCPRYSKLMRDFESTEAYQKLLDPNQQIQETLITQSGIGINASIDDKTDVLDALFVQQLSNMKIPEWARNSIFQPMLAFTARRFALETHTPELSRLRVGPFLKLVLENINGSVTSDKASEEDKELLKMSMFSAHDKVIAEVLNALGIYDMKIPPYATVLMIELHKDPSYEDFHLNILYRNDTTRSPYVLEVPGCGSPCFLNEFIRITEHLIPKNWEEECQDLAAPVILSISKNGETRVTGLQIFIFFSCLVSIASIVAMTAFIFVNLRKMLNPSRNQSTRLIQNSYSTDTENPKTHYEAMSK